MDNNRILQAIMHHFLGKFYVVCCTEIMSISNVLWKLPII